VIGETILIAVQKGAQAMKHTHTHTLYLIVQQVKK